MQKTSVALNVILLITLQISGVSCSANKTPGDKYNTDTIPARFTSVTLPAGGNIAAEKTDFVTASKIVTPAVVHIKTTFESNGDYGQGMYGMGGGTAIGSGSGVIISADGYIATNNHVVEHGADIQVILPDKRVFKAKLIGLDQNTDLALVKIDATDLPFIQFGNSDETEVGQWVLAVGYPFSLNTTVTAGIISAKGRNIGIIHQSGNMGNAGRASSSAIESFIQTDAAINPGNSGGALVNTAGQLIGINSAIASQTGSYAGYAFAIPANLAKKILNDLQKYGVVKRGVLGVSYPAPLVEDQYLQQKGLAPGSVKGVYITSVAPGSAAAAAGLKEGDIIQSIDGTELTSSSEFSERIARHRPGETISLTYLRNGKVSPASATLKSEQPASETENSASLSEIYNRLGATFKPLPDELRTRLNLKEGVVVSEIKRGGFFDQLGIPPGTIIAYINGKAINNPKDIDAALLSAQRGTIQMFAIAPDGSRVVFNFSLGT